MVDDVNSQKLQRSKLNTSHLTPSRILLFFLCLAFVIYKIATEDDISKSLALTFVIVGAMGTVLFAIYFRKGMFAKKDN